MIFLIPRIFLFKTFSSLWSTLLFLCKKFFCWISNGQWSFIFSAWLIITRSIFICSNKIFPLWDTFPWSVKRQDMKMLNSHLPIEIQMRGGSTKAMWIIWKHPTAGTRWNMNSPESGTRKKINGSLWSHHNKRVALENTCFRDNLVAQRFLDVKKNLIEKLTIY